MGIRYYKKKRALKYTEKQLQEILIRARHFYRELLKHDYELVMDDEKYFLLHNEFVPANRDFYSSDRQTTVPDAKFKRIKKFEPRLFTRLMPFIESYHNKENVLFWPDLASSHYGHDVIWCLNDNKVKFVPIEYNPQNCPQSCPIETLWSIIDDMVHDNGWEAKSIDQLKRRIIAKLKEIDLKLVQTMLSGIRTQLRKIADKGPYEACYFLLLQL
ncbi:unnamed protein product [Rotaria socialis]|uniref:Uncharacterized protein n=1 Tax=Rotaria socialis TaxID=392032 RepID=A0A818CCN5_9BILA|nr:unnamed protein product [Rotaria socialis]CAF4529467.1 unnamed protein product [Rotaria socialis]